MARGTSSKSRNTSPAPRGRGSQAASQSKPFVSRRSRRDVEDDEEEDIELDDVGDASQEGHNVRLEA